MGDPRERRRELGEDGHEGGVDEDHPVLSMVDDVCELLREQADVERVQHRARAGDREVELEVALVVPGERPHAVSLADAETGEHACQPVDAIRHLRVCRARDQPILAERHHLRSEVASAHPATNVVQGQLEVVLHQPMDHLASSSPRSFPWRQPGQPIVDPPRALGDVVPVEAQHVL